MPTPIGELTYGIERGADGLWHCEIMRWHGPDDGCWKSLVIGKHKSVTGALHTAQQMALDVLSAPTTKTKEG